jgi:hypothetical protein
MTDSLGRILALVAVAAGIYWAATTYFVHSAPGYTKAEAAVQQQASSRGLPTSDVRCGQSSVPPPSIAYVAHVVMPHLSGVTLYECTSLAANGGGTIQWCVVGASGAYTWYAQNEDCQSWAASSPAGTQTPSANTGGQTGTTAPSGTAKPPATAAEKKAAARYFSVLRQIDLTTKRAWLNSVDAMKPVNLHKVTPAWYAAQPILGSASQVLHSAGLRVEATPATGGFRLLGHDLAYMYFDAGALLDRYSTYLVVRNASDFSSTEPDLIQDHTFLVQHTAAFKAQLREISQWLGNPAPSWTAHILQP